ncbi:flagellar biosynthesis protein FlhF [Bacillus sp. REN16]|uniref:flagellar biosynthesis protein FlhF n=1 Tax=Bacillus sp. REN16 TaxID=2887296 RepID=UPI001E54C042|nr:flagellar biosynthesis protein FlhF [Bacillus sp. REN16]MCC3357455.1 flagellar biosynthesis protein FlhF [Bacillus sp. REN16]
MKVKKYIAPSMPEAMKMIRSELGSEAVILNSKIVQTQGFFGLFRKKNFEVIAAIDPEIPRKQMLQPKEKERKVPVTDNPIVQSKPVVSEPITKYEAKESHDPSPELLKEINELKAAVKEISSDINPYTGPLQEINQLLQQQEVEASVRKEIMSRLMEKWYLTSEKASFEDIKNWTKECIISKISNVNYGGLTYQKKYINVVGPTGVGKTTTIAKIAADCMLKDKKRIAFITTDTFRIAAIEQLKTYAKILGAPVEVCYSFEDFKKAKETYKNYDVVFIDTAGRNFRNEKYIDDLNDLIHFSNDMETFLVLSLTSKMNDMKMIYNQFSKITISKFIFTKVDETANYGAMVNLIVDSGIGVAYLTNGQNVPDDIVKASPSLIANTTLGVDES